MGTTKVPPAVLYSYWRSSCSYRVRNALHLKNIPFEVRPINLEKNGGEQHNDEFRRVNPMQKIPALIIDGHTLVESLNIMQYLEETRPEIPLMPKDAYQRAKVRELCEMIQSGIQPLQNVGLLARLEYDKKKKIAWAQYWIDRGLKAVETVLSSTSDQYSVGNQITLADCCLIPQVFNARKFEVDLIPFPTITRIDKELESHPAFVDAHPLSQPDCPSKGKQDILQ